MEKRQCGVTVTVTFNKLSLSQVSSNKLNYCENIVMHTAFQKCFTLCLV